MAEKTVRLTVTANLLEMKGAKEIPKGVAYAFSSGGLLLGREPLNEKGTAVLTFAGTTEAMAVRVMVGPDLQMKEAPVRELRRRGAVEHHLRIDPGQINPSVEIAVLPDRWKCWLLGICFVRGTLLKRVVSEGVPDDLPVCHAAVEIYEVDPIWVIIPRLPDDIIERIRHIILNPPPPPPPPDGPIVPFPPGPNPRAEFMSSEMASAVKGASRSPTAGEVPRAMSGAADLQFLARNTNTFEFRRALVDNAVLVRPLLCHFFPVLVTMDLVATATTDECGHFQTFFFRGCSNPDTPDLYFKAKQRVLPPPFPPFTIYAPTPIACYTHWDYACGTEVTLYTSNPLAITCAPCPDVDLPPGTKEWVLVMAVGNHPLSLIRGTGVDLQPTTNATNLGLTEGDAPWGGLLRLRLEFDNRLRDPLGVKYYRVGWHKGTNPADPFQDVTAAEGTVQRHYAHWVAGNLAIDPYPLGPVTVGQTPNLFEIPPALPPLGQWSVPDDAVEGLTNAKFRSTVHAPGLIPPPPGSTSYSGTDSSGKHQLKIDLFNAAGNLVDITTLGIKYLVPTSTVLLGSIGTADAAELMLVIDDDGDGMKSFIMTLHIDNNVCNAIIGPPTLNGTPATACGVLEYTPATGALPVIMPYTAAHPNRFATYSFSVVRGANPPDAVPLPPPTSGQVPALPGTTSTSQTVDNLRGTCIVASFSANLHVAAMATDGVSRLGGYDRSHVLAFVLARPGPGGGPG